MRKYLLLVLASFSLVYFAVGYLPWMINGVGFFHEANVISPGEFILGRLGFPMSVLAVLATVPSLYQLCRRNRIGYHILTILVAVPMTVITSIQAKAMIDENIRGARIGRLQRRYFPIADVLLNYYKEKPEAFTHIQGTEEVLAPSFLDYCEQKRSPESLGIRIDGKTLLDDLGKPIRYYINENNDDYIETAQGKVSVMLRQTTNAVIFASDGQVVGVSGFKMGW